MASRAILTAILAFSSVEAVVASSPEFILPRQTATTFQLAATGSLAPFGLTSTCEQVLCQPISCVPYVKGLGLKAYHGSPGNTAFTNTVCAASCSTALTNARRRITGSCATTPNLFPGYPVIAIIDAVVSGWNETCLKDTDGGYCNAKIEAFPPTDRLEDMPQAQVCSFCLGEKLRLMQRSPYSAYDELHAETLKYINQKCGKSGPITTQPPVISPNGTTPDACGGGNKYTVKAGDTCNKISVAHSVSSSTLYHINPTLLNCTNPTPNTQLCLPVTCPTTYTVQADETCVAIANRFNTTSSWQDIVAWNTGLDNRCSNIWSPPSSSRYWGNVICVSAPGGLPDPALPPGSGNGNGGIGGPGGSGDGYADFPVAAPQGGRVAPGTTTHCGFYVRAGLGTTCTGLVGSAAVPIGLFLAANKSLKSAATCTQDLVIGNWYCLHPVRRFEDAPTTTATTAPAARTV